MIPLEEPSEAVHERLSKLGVTATVCSPWPLGDPAFASLDAKVNALGEFARRFLGPRS